jgi:hypothetical protein
MSQCDGEWEHEYGIKINTVDNPGWYIEIDLAFTSLENENIDIGTIENSEHDWYFYQIKDKKFRASGDTTKLFFLLGKFKEIAEANPKGV